MDAAEQPAFSAEIEKLLPQTIPQVVRKDVSVIVPTDIAKASNKGLSTRQALHLLEKLIDAEQSRFLISLSWKEWFRDALGYNSQRSIFRWTEGLVLLVQIIIVIVVLSIHSTSPDSSRVYSSAREATIVLLVLLSFLCLNIFLSCWDARTRHTELWRQTNAVKELIQRELHDTSNKRSLDWKPSVYPDLQSPDSPGITLQWTYRDGVLVNLPAVLLVLGDIVLIRPSQRVHCRCLILAEDSEETTKNLTLQVGDVFQPDVEGELEHPVGPKERESASPCRFTVLDAPFKVHLQESLSNKTLHRPSSVIEKQRLIVWGYIERWIVPIFVSLFVVSNIVKVTAVHKAFEERWPEEILYGLLYILLPISPLVFPSLWLVVNYIILARVLSVFHKFKRKKFKHDSLHEAKLTDAIYTVKADWLSTWKRFRAFVQGRNESLCQTANLVHTLGNVTSVCCVDKKGVLSWPNPNAEKVFVLRPRAESVSTSKVSLRQSTSSLQEMVYITDDLLAAKSFDRHNSLSVVAHEPGGSVAEVLDITQNGGKAFDIDFDDPSWVKLKDSLKPLGLGIMLNTCNGGVQDYYRAFTDHVSCVALHHDQTVPVINRRCLCALSDLIGFSSSAPKVFKQIQRIAVYRKPPKTPRANIGRYKTPFPNMLSVIAQDKNSGGSHVMSQGTADLVLDVCTDYWNGQEVRPLTDEERKYILEFYTRFSMTAYCAAFCYSAMIETVPEYESDSDSDSEDVFIELPTEDDESSVHELSSQTGESDSSTELLHDLHESCCKNQIFLGCVAQQYQSRNEFVHLIDLLEQACIRFIHFSPETELRSRVFAERLGLESGWNCHISLDSKGIDPTSLDSDITLQPLPEGNQRRSKTTIVVEPEINLENRARLPRGIENIRDHIEEVDNVPLLVSLFTDCTPDSIKEMIAIMQENGEVVCCLGSSASLYNCSVFLQADISIAIEPMYPQSCLNKHSFNQSSDRKPTHCLPTELMRMLLSLNCSLSCQKEDPQSLMQLVIESRHNLAILRNCCQYLLSASISLVFLLTTSSLLCLPPALSLGHILLLVCISLPFLAVSLLSSPHDRNLMRISTGKNRTEDILSSREGVRWRLLRTLLVRWLPSILIVLLCHILLLSQHCTQGALTCYPILFNLFNMRNSIKLSQNFCGLLVVLYCSVISLGYGTSRPGIWKYSPWKNKFWFLAVLVSWVLQVVFFVVDVPVVRHDFSSLRNISREEGLEGKGEELVEFYSWTDIPYWIWLTGFLWPFILLPLNELIKRFELSELDKLQKRARLEFGTKLGMNSPF